MLTLRRTGSGDRAATEISLGVLRVRSWLGTVGVALGAGLFALVAYIGWNEVGARAASGWIFMYGGFLFLCLYGLAAVALRRGWRWYLTGLGALTVAAGFVMIYPLGIVVPVGALLVADGVIAA